MPVKNLYMLPVGCSLTDSSDLSNFLVLVSSYNSKAQCHNDCGGRVVIRRLNLGKPACVTDTVVDKRQTNAKQ